MNKQLLTVNMEVEVPDGFKAVAYRVPVVGDISCDIMGGALLLWLPGYYLPNTPRVILCKIKPEIRTAWVNVYPKGHYRDVVWFDKKQADIAAGDGRLACVEIKYKVPLIRETTDMGG